MPCTAVRTQADRGPAERVAAEQLDRGVGPVVAPPSPAGSGADPGRRRRTVDDRARAQRAVAQPEPREADAGPADGARPGRPRPTPEPGSPRPRSPWSRPRRCPAAPDAAEPTVPTASRPPQPQPRPRRPRDRPTPPAPDAHERAEEEPRHRQGAAQADPEDRRARGAADRRRCGSRGRGSAAPQARRLPAGRADGRRDVEAEIAEQTETAGHRHHATATAGAPGTHGAAGAYRRSHGGTQSRRQAVDRAQYLRPEQ